MANFVQFVLLHFLLIVHIRAVPENESQIIKLGSSISPIFPPTSWPSASGHFAFGFYPQGNGFAVGIWLLTQPENTIVWTANRDDPPLSSNSTLELTSAGIKLHARTEKDDKGEIISDSGDLSLESAISASMLDSGNFVLYGNNSSVVWQSFDHPTDTLLGSQILSSGSNLTSSMSKSDHSTGRFFLAMKTDGNLFAYPVNSSHAPDDAYWATATFSKSTDYFSSDTDLTLDYNGNLSLTQDELVLKKLVTVTYSTHNRLVIYRATLDPDGIFRLYSHQFEINNGSKMSTEWTNLQDQCDVKGFCSLNSYCSSSGREGDCHCYPGFIWRNPGNKLLGCAQNKTEDVCRKDLKVNYNMTSMENIWWSDYPYIVVRMAEEDCSRSCQEDCNCGAALYDSGNCQKYKQPLRYGKRNRNITSTGFFKVIIAIHNLLVPVPAQVKTILQGKDSVVVILSTSLGSIAFFCFVFALITFVKYWRQVVDYKKLSGNPNLGLQEEFALRSFSYNELEKATNNFTEELGSGSFGAVYRGSSGSNTIAVKRVEKVVEEGERAFRAEMATIGRTYHKNLVRLLGFCVEGSKKLLVYEYMKKGSLADILFKAENNRPVWKERVRIAADVARGILYLHEECEVHIIHCNIKPQNILIDDSWTAKISDFGLAKVLARNQTSIGELLSQSKGHSAPEWQRNNLISVKADIYSFGVVLFEIICCRSNAEVEDEMTLCGWVKKCYLGRKLEKLIAEDQQVDMKTFERMVKVGLWCIQDDPNLRPPIKDVVLMLEGTMEVPLPPSPAFSIDI